MMEGLSNSPEFRAIAMAVWCGDCPADMLCDWLLEHGAETAKAAESLVPYVPSQWLLRHHYDDRGSGSGIGIGIGSGRGSGSGIGIGIGSGRGSGSGIGIGNGNGREQEGFLLEPGKVYLIETVDWYAWVGRCKRQVGPWEYEFESCSKISNTNNGDVWHLLAAGDEDARRHATYLHYSQPVILGMGAVVKVEWKGKTPQEQGLPG